MNKDEVRGTIHGTIGAVGHLSNPNATDPLKNALYQSFEALLSMLPDGEAATAAVEETTSMLDTLAALEKDLRSLTEKANNIQKMAETLARDFATAGRETKQMGVRLDKLEKVKAKDAPTKSN
jgi:hypothetical protein